MIKKQKIKRIAIIVPHGVKAELMKMCRTTYPTIKKALNGYEGNSKAIEIRKRALEKGGFTYER